MDKWMTCEDIERTEVMPMINLALLVDNGDIIAFDKQTAKPLDWDWHFAQHINLKKVFGTNKYGKRTYICSDAQIIPLEGLYKQAAHWIKIEAYKGTEEEYLFDYDSRLNISYEQYALIKRRWGIEHTIEVINNFAMFKESELEKATSEEPSESSIDDKTLLKIIGALVEINYLQKGTSKYITEKGKPIIAAIADSIHADLGKAGIKTEGLRDRNLRDKIKIALKTISENKV